MFWTRYRPRSRQADSLLTDCIVVRAAEPRPFGGDHRRPAGTWNRFARHGFDGCRRCHIGGDPIQARYARKDRHDWARANPAHYKHQTHHGQEHREKGAAVFQQPWRRGRRHEENVSWWVPSFYSAKTTMSTPEWGKRVSARFSFGLPSFATPS